MKLRGEGMLELTRQEVLLRHAARESISRVAARALPLVVGRARGVEVWDVDGKRYLDFFAGGGALALGHNHPSVVEAVREHLDDHVHTDVPTPLRDAFVTELLGFLPRKLRREMRVELCAPSGSDAVEAALKLCKRKTGRSGVIAFHGGWHGATGGALAVSSLRDAKRRVSTHMPDVSFAPYSYCLRCPLKLEPSSCNTACAALFETMLDDCQSGIAEPAAILMEFVQSEGGCIAATTDFAQRVRRAATAATVPLIADEVQTGLGRTGRWWAFEHSDIEPDVIIASKALGGIGLPIAALFYRRELEVWEDGSQPGAFRPNQLAMAAGLVALRVMRREGVAQNAAERGEELRAGLCEIVGRSVAEVRGLGLMLGIEFADPETNAPQPEVARRVRDECFARGLLCALGGRHDATLRLLPPLVVSSADVRQALGILEASLAAVDLPRA